MEQVRGTFRRPGKPAVKGTDIHLIVDVSGSEQRWYGSFELSEDAPLWETGDYDLELPDGRYGRVVITHLRAMVGAPKTGPFTGQGRLCEPEV